MTEHEQYATIGRQRATCEESAIVEAVERLVTVRTENDLDTEPLVEKFERTLAGLPARYRREFEGMADALPVSREAFGIYAFALSKLSSVLTDDDADADPDPDLGEGCTNVVVSGDRTADGAPLVLKNRDISGRGVRPQAAIEYPAIDAHHGFVTVSTCGTPLVYQGVNDAGLVAANSFINITQDGVTPEQRLRNGVIIRHLLEEAASVVEACRLVESMPIEYMKGLTLALADATDAALLDIDPINEEIRPAAGPIIERANHFPGDEETRYESSGHRYDRMQDLTADFPEEIGIDDLFGAAADHDHGRHPNSICRHGNDESDPLRLNQSTTVSTTVYRGGEPVCHGIVGNPCGSSPIRYRYGDDHAVSHRSGGHWLDTVGTAVATSPSDD
ncbi:MAG: C45 family autoproteolytic acyltransferase/hydrolase [Halobacteriales archaeon]